MPANDNTVMMESVRIIFRNFAGKEGQYNREGDRNFAVLLDPKTAAAMAEDQWNVKMVEASYGRGRRRAAGIFANLS